MTSTNVVLSLSCSQRDKHLPHNHITKLMQCRYRNDLAVMRNAVRHRWDNAYLAKRRRCQSGRDWKSLEEWDGVSKKAVNQVCQSAKALYRETLSLVSSMEQITLAQALRMENIVRREYLIALDRRRWGDIVEDKDLISSDLESVWH